jgi:hypothetical protein
VGEQLINRYTHAVHKDMLAAQDQVMEAMLKPGAV